MATITTTNKTKQQCRETGMQREDTKSGSGLREGGEGSIAGGTNQKDSGPDRIENKGRGSAAAPLIGGSDFVGFHQGNGHNKE
jgi:hypothetical protein